MHILLVFLLLAAASESSHLEKISCRGLRGGTGSQRVLCAELWKQGDANQYYLSLRDESRRAADGRARLIHRTEVTLAADEFLDLEGFDATGLKNESILFLPVNKGDPKFFAEGFSLLYRYHPKSKKFTKLKTRLICQRKCTLQLLSYQSGGGKTLFFYETKINGQYLKSTYQWKDGRMTPIDIDEPRAADALSRGYKTPPSMPICERTPAVMMEILRRIEGKSCERITDMDLATVTFLALDRKKIEKLKPGDFSGLPKLTRINLSHNPIQKLPPGLFDGLFLLRSLNFQGCKLPTVPAGLFLHLGSLRNLYLNHNKIAELPQAVFLGLSSLTFLSLNHNQLKSLPEKIFEPFPKACNVYLSNNPLKK
ncbi:MAG: leucine-rich repeat domain-containing protein [Deltaproteobacteria bacterium]|nr:leucine-rich repeat domain-containing protein [Deltaproteobacteria bacterium]